MLDYLYSDFAGQPTWMWLAFLAFMAIRGVSLGALAWRLHRRDAWFAAP